MTSPIDSSKESQPGLLTPGEELTRQRRIRQLSVSLFETPDQTDVVGKALDGTIEILRADGASFWAASDEEFVCQLARGSDGDRLTGSRLASADLLADDADELVLVAPVTIGGATVGAIRAARGPVSDTGSFSLPDHDALGDIADSVGAALYAAVRAESSEKSQDFALVLEMSRQIGSSLDLDRVLRTVVNLAAKAVEFERGAVALYDAGKCDIRAVAGLDRVDSKAPELQDLAVRAAWAVGVGQRFYLSDRTEPSTDAERIFLQIFGQDLEASRVGSGLYLPLADEEGKVGILVFEAERLDFATERQQELLTVLANQTTVAIRNAQLYARVPLAETLSAFNLRRREWLALPERKRLLAALIGAAVLAGLVLIRWPLRVPAIDPTFLPMSRAEVRSLIPGVVEEVLIREGAAVERGDPIARFRDTETRAERDAMAAAVAAADRAATLAASRRDPSEERLQRLRVASLRQELAVQDERLALLTLRSPISGIVLTPRPEERLDAKLDAGETFALIGRTDSLELEFGVDQRDIDRVRPGAEVRLRVEAFPQRTFVGTVVALSHLPLTDHGEPVFAVRAIVPNESAALKPGMIAQARVLTAPMSALGRLGRTPVRLLRLWWWRLWSWA